jgi:hypothetical protein
MLSLSSFLLIIAVLRSPSISRISLVKSVSIVQNIPDSKRES